MTVTSQSSQSNRAGPGEDLLRAIDDAPAPPASDKVDALRAECERLRSDDQEIQDLTERLDALVARRQTRLRETVPDLMDQVGVTELSLAAAGNAPAVTIRIKPYYRASIAADWPDDKKQAAFDWLDANDCGDLIKTEVTVPFAREDREKALAAVALLKRAGYGTVLVNQAVHFMTLTKWLKERCEGRRPLPPLDLIGGAVGRVAEIKPTKER